MSATDSASQLSGRTGLSADFFEPTKLAHLGVEAPVEAVSAALSECGRFLSPPAAYGLRLETHVEGKPRGEVSPLAHVFQLRGQTWTQAFFDIRSVQSELLLARHLSMALAAHCVCLGITDDAYYSHALFAGGTLEELAIFAMDVDVVRVLRSLDLAVPVNLEHADPDDPMTCEDDEEFDYRRDGLPAHSAANVGRLVGDLGCYLHAVFAPREPVYGLDGVRTDDFVRMDVLWRGECPWAGSVDDSTLSPASEIEREPRLSWPDDIASDR